MPTRGQARLLRNLVDGCVLRQMQQPPQYEYWYLFWPGKTVAPPTKTIHIMLQKGWLVPNPKTWLEYNRDYMISEAGREALAWREGNG